MLFGGEIKTEILNDRWVMRSICLRDMWYKFCWKHNSSTSNNKKKYYKPIDDESRRCEAEDNKMKDEKLV